MLGIIDSPIGTMTKTMYLEHGMIVEKYSTKQKKKIPEEDFRFIIVGIVPIAEKNMMREFFLIKIA